MHLKWFLARHEEGVEVAVDDGVVGEPPVLGQAHDDVGVAVVAEQRLGEGIAGPTSILGSIMVYDDG